MTFTTATFVVFLAIVFSLYWSLDRKRQNLLLVTASLIFYGWWDWRFVFLMLLTAFIDFYAAIRIDRTQQPNVRRRWLVLSIISNLGILGFFKYANFFSSSVHSALQQVGWDVRLQTLDIILPVGISFYTFQALSYTIDVYRGQLTATRDPIQYLAFISFFPQLVAGPIERASHLLGQFARERQFDRAEAADGARQMLWGFFKKLVIADNLAIFVNATYSDPSASGWQLLWATYGFAFQIYCDFSGYTDIAIGCGRLFNFRLMRNFAYPYFSTSIPEFWRRWHISLSTWFRDYVYVPLGGNRSGLNTRVRNVLIVFVLSGLWHGANWTFIVWGALHGVLYCIYLFIFRVDGRERSLQTPPALNMRNVLNMLLTFQLVCIAWVFFRSPDVQTAGSIIGRIAHALVTSKPELPSYGAAFIGVLFLVTVEWLGARHAHALEIAHWRRRYRYAVYYAVAIALVLFASLRYEPFIYFQF